MSNSYIGGLRRNYSNLLIPQDFECTGNLKETVAKTWADPELLATGTKRGGAGARATVNARQTSDLFAKADCRVPMRWQRQGHGALPPLAPFGAAHELESNVTGCCSWIMWFQVNEQIGLIRCPCPLTQWFDYIIPTYDDPDA